MDMAAGIDLEELLARAWDAQTKVYLRDAILAYRVGAYRLAIVGTWTATAYDIITKLRGLAVEQDARARDFITTFDRAVTQGNVPQLLKIERCLLTTAVDFQLIGVQEAAMLARLWEDRHLCAHPAFTPADELFEPTAELVRAHIAQAVSILISLPPRSGKSILNTFDSDLPSSAFPRERDRAVAYVTERYLHRMRPSTVRNFANAVAKAFVRGDRAEWVGQDDSLLDAMEAVERFDAAYFRDDLSDRIVRLIDDAEQFSLLRSLPLMRRFPAIVKKLLPTTLARLHALAENDTAEIYHFCSSWPIRP